MLSLMRPSAGRLEALVREQRDEALSYREAGATQSTLPPGYRYGRHEVELGHGEAVFAQAVDGLQRWRVHNRARVEVIPGDAPVETGTDVVLDVRIARVHLTLVCRIVYVTAEAHRFGFAYGTLPRHVLEGEEAFVVEHDENGVVRFTITAFVRPHGALARLAPFVDELDQYFVRRYLRAMQDHVADRV